MGLEHVDALRTLIYPLTATFTPQPPLIPPSRLLLPLTSPSRALGTLAKLTSVTEITAPDSPCQAENRNAVSSQQLVVSLLSSENERTFSDTRLIISNNRIRLWTDVEALK